MTKRRRTIAAVCAGLLMIPLVGNRLGRGIHDLIGVLWLRARLLDYQIREVTHV